MTTEFGPCETWPVLWPCDIACESPEVTGSAAAFATEVVWALSGQQFGFCTVTLRPCRRDCFDSAWPFEIAVPGFPGSGFVTPLLHNGQWFNIVCDQCSGTCSCTEVSEVLLPASASEIVEVKVDGVTLPSSAYRLDDYRILVRIDGDRWPLCNDLNEADTEIGTWSVTAKYGRQIPQGGEWAVGELACEFLRAIKGEDCRLPRNVTQIARQGVTITYPDVGKIFSNGRTGLYLTDIFIATWNPSNLKNASKTYNVDNPSQRRTGT